MDTTTALPLLAILLPNLELLVIAALASCLPISFFLWLKWWLSSVKDEHPDEVIAEQAKADQAHLEHHSHGHGPGDGHGHGANHHHAHA